MDSDTFLIESGETLKCRICKNYLSYLPIYITYDGKSICGRCRTTSNEVKSSQNVAFEAVSKFVSFPCRYENDGCNEEMVPEKISNHEPICPYKVLKCPSANFTVCNWKGARPTVMQHCLDNHAEFFLNETNEFLENFSQPSPSSANFLSHDNVLYIFSRTFDTISNVFHYSIHHTEDGLDVKNCPYQLSLQSGTAVLVNKCSTTSYQEKLYKSIVLDSLNAKNELSIISGRITFDKCTEDAVSMHGKLNMELLSQLQCSDCFTYVLPPIYIYEDHKICCSNCKTGNRFRNYNLDNIAKMLYYPCVNKDNGCDVVLKPEEMEKHQNVCDYRLLKCPVYYHEDCSWKGVRTDLSNHLHKSHKRKFSSNDSQITATLLTELDLQFNLMRYLDHLLLIEFFCEENSGSSSSIRSFYWRVQQVDYFKETFQFEVEVLDKTNSRRFLGRQTSVLFPVDDYSSIKEEECCVLSFTSRQLQNLLENNGLHFRVSIFQ